MGKVVSGHEHECFTDPAEGTFDITGLRQLIRIKAIPGELRSVDIDPIIAYIDGTTVKPGVTIDHSRVWQLGPESWRDDPGIFVVLKESKDKGIDKGSDTRTVLMVDGHHRAVRRHLEGFHTIWMWFIHEEHVVRPTTGCVHDKDIIDKTTTMGDAPCS